MADGIAIARCTLGNGWEIIADYVQGAERVEWTLRTPHDQRVRVKLTALEVQVLTQMRDEAERGT